MTTCRLTANLKSFYENGPDTTGRRRHHHMTVVLAGVPAKDHAWLTGLTDHLACHFCRLPWQQALLTCPDVTSFSHCPLVMLGGERHAL